MAGVSGLSSLTGSEPMSSTGTSCQHHSGASDIPLPGCFVWLIAVAVLCFGNLSARALTEYELKAAFLFNFAKFVDWPPRAFPEASAPLIFGIIGEDPFGST